MKDFVIKFSEEAGLSNLFLASVNAAYFSVLIRSLNPMLQFTSSLIFFSCLIGFFTFLSSKEEGGKSFLFLQAVLIGLSGVHDFRYLLAASPYFLLYGAYFLFLGERKYVLAFISQLSDLVSTKAALPGLSESNPVLNKLITAFGVDYALVIVKIVLIGSLLFYCWKKLEGEGENLFLNAVIVTGFSMAIRNTVLILIS